MPITFLTYAAAMLALCGFPLFFSGFWSKDEILHAASTWTISKTPFYLGAFGALLTAFYMTRQVYYVFGGKLRLGTTNSESDHASSHDADNISAHASAHPHESSAVMTVPLVILAGFAIFLGLIGTPAWPWFQSFLTETRTTLHIAAFVDPTFLSVMLSSSLLVFLGLGLGWWFYGRKPITSADAPDTLAQLQPHLFSILGHNFYVDAFYRATIIRLNTWWSLFCAWLDRWIWNGAVQTVSYLVLAFAWIDNFFDMHVVNAGFDEGCETVSRSGQLLSLLQGGRVQSYLRMIGVALIALAIFLFWGARG